MPQSVSTVRSYVLHSMSPLISWDYLHCCFNRYSWSWASFELTAGQCKVIMASTSVLFVLYIKLSLLSFRMLYLALLHPKVYNLCADKGSYWRRKAGWERPSWGLGLERCRGNKLVLGRYMGPWFSKCGPLASSSTIAQELVRNENPTESESLRWD